MAEPKKTGSLVVGEQSGPPPLPCCNGLVSESGTGSSSPPKFVVNVIFTTWHGTKAALSTASQWARCLDARIVLWSPQVVPRQFSVTAPPVSKAFTEQRLQSLVGVYCEDLEIVIRVCLCRDLELCVLNVLEPDSIVLVGGKKRWLRTQEQALACLLHAFGHRVLFIPTKENVPATVTTSKRIPN
jgi:hypothetical protein